MDYEELATRAKDSDYRGITCPSCQGTGSRLKLDGISSETCFCGGSGRMWLRGTSTSHFTDRQLAERLGLRAP
jgi:hypothetical protein